MPYPETIGGQRSFKFFGYFALPLRHTYLPVVKFFSDSIAA